MSGRNRFHLAAILPLIALLAFFSGVATAADKATTKPAPFEKDIEAFEKKDKTNPPPREANLFIGSSSIVKWKTLASDFPDVPVINRGFGGSRIEDSVRYADRIVIPYHPRRIFLYAGDNDIAGGHSPEQVLADFKAFIEKVRAGLGDVPIYYISIKPSPSREKLLDKIKEANHLIEEYIKGQKNLTYVDIFTPMLSAEGKPRPELFTPDMLHMARPGYEIWIARIAPLLKSGS